MTRDERLKDEQTDDGRRGKPGLRGQEQEQEKEQERGQRPGHRQH